MATANPALEAAVLLLQRSLNNNNRASSSDSAGIPPFSRNASHNMRLLPGQVCGIVGAYVFAIAVIGLCLLTFGRRLRKAAQSALNRSETELKPWNRTQNVSALSPSSSQRTWPLWGSPNRTRSSLRKSAASLNSTASFDQKVLEQDKYQRQIEMERLYAAVLQQEDGKPSRVTLNEVQEDVETAYTASKGKDLRVDIGAVEEAVPDSAGYPPSTTSVYSQGTSRSPLKQFYPRNNLPLRASQPTTGASRPFRDVDPSDALLSRRHDDDASGSSSSSQENRVNPRNLHISISTADSPTSDDDDDDALTPLAPRHKQRSQAFNLPTSPRKQFQPPLPLSEALSSRIPAITLNSSPSTLPFRAMAPASPSWNSIQTTTLEPRPGLLSPSLLRTGLPTPYSPYMPFTPVTPVALHLVSRQERRIREREEGRGVVCADAEGDWGRAKGEEELWGGGY